MSESTILFGSKGGLVGTLALPDEGNDGHADIGFLFLNAGVVHRVGPHRINVRIARQLAARGIPSIRFDLCGHGDSVRVSGESGTQVRVIAEDEGGGREVRTLVIGGVHP